MNPTLFDQLSALPTRYKQLTEAEMVTRIRDIKHELGDELLIPGHHYQRDEVIQFADVTGDSLQLAQICAQNRQAKHIVFCGVHFMAETADMLTTNAQTVYLPDMRAGCSMADMANMTQTTRAWEALTQLFGNTIVPLTYVNSTASIKAFVGQHGGACVTSSNAKKMVEWAFTQRTRLLFLPDQHLGRNTAFDLGIRLDQMAVWDPIHEKLRYEGNIADVRVILWQGHCSVHEGFQPWHIEHIRTHEPDMNIIVHPECSHEVVQAADDNGSTKYIIDTIAAAPSGSRWAIGTEMNLVKRLIAAHPDKHIISLNTNMCPCLTMNRIDLPHLLWALEMIVAGERGNVISVDAETTAQSLLALERMLQFAT
ncbi:quinolinate synthase NadA [Kurthia massiliensis]|uniref:quinolinate synthase NadA n=1 Tax=Kurthia massiliensis TaxID=1033739 RepID=UPI000288910B|nr:quinolinate synthase NadA [Kurthia massiliensis]